MIRELTCIQCPMGCPLKVEIEDGKVISVTGNTCPRGKVYAEKEVTAPTRTVTSTVAVNGGERAVVAVKTAGDVPKELIFKCMEEINGASVDAPVHIGDVIVKNVCSSGTDVVATADCKKN